MAVGLTPALKKICKRQNSPPHPLSLQAVGSVTRSLLLEAAPQYTSLQKAPGQACRKPKQSGWDRLLLAAWQRPAGGRHPHRALLHRRSVPAAMLCPFRCSEEAWCAGLSMGTGCCALGGNPGLEAGGQNLPEPFLRVPPCPAP